MNITASENNGLVEDTSNRLLSGIENLIEKTRKFVAVYLNMETCLLYRSIGHYIINELHYETYSQSGQRILATLSRKLSEKFGKGYTYSGLNRMIKVAEIYSDEKKFATLSRTLTQSLNKMQ